MAPLLDSIRSLSEAATDLNEKTDELNDVFLEVEKRLADARVGVSIWLADGEQLLDQSSRRDGRYTGWALGYAKIGSEWRLAAKRVAGQEVTSSINRFEEPDVFEDLEDPVALVKAPRSVRVEAAAVLEQLVDQLTERVKLFAANIERAKELVRNG